MFRNQLEREAYRRGVRDALASITTHHPPPHLRALCQWTDDLERWHSGSPPPAPYRWPESTTELLEEDPDLYPE